MHIVTPEPYILQAERVLSIVLHTLIRFRL